MRVNVVKIITESGGGYIPRQYIIDDIQKALGTGRSPEDALKIIDKELVGYGFSE